MWWWPRNRPELELATNCDAEMAFYSCGSAKVVFKQLKTEVQPFAPRCSVKKICSKIRSFFTDQSGPTTVEYSVMIALIVGALVVAGLSVGYATQNMSDETVSSLDSALNE